MQVHVLDILWERLESGVCHRRLNIRAAALYSSCVYRSRELRVDFAPAICMKVLNGSYYYTRIGSNKGKTPEHKQAKHTKHPHSVEWQLVFECISRDSTRVLDGQIQEIRMLASSFCSTSYCHTHNVTYERANAVQVYYLVVCVPTIGLRVRTAPLPLYYWDTESIVG